jgi:hypothetical protein
MYIFYVACLNGFSCFYIFCVGLLMSPTHLLLPDEEGLMLIPDEEGLVLMSGDLGFLFTINHESTPNMASSSKATTRREGTPTPVVDGTNYSMLAFIFLNFPYIIL